MAHLAFIFCCFVWGTSFILLERVTHVFGPVEIAVWRMFSGAAVIGLFWWFRPGEYRIERRDWAHMIILALVLTAPPQVIQAYVLSQGFGHSFFGTMVAAVPLLTILVSVPMLGALPSSRELVGVLGGLACLSLLVEDGVHRGMSAGLLALTFLIPLSSAISNTFIKWKLRNVPAAPLTATLLLVAGTALLPLQFSPRAMGAMDVAGPVDATATPTAILYLFLLGVVGSGISTMVFVWMVLKKGPLFAGMTTYVVPVLALLWGTIDHETISQQQMIAIVGVLSMVALVQSTVPRPFTVVEPVGAGDAITSLPISAESEMLAMEPESQVA